MLRSLTTAAFAAALALAPLSVFAMDDKMSGSGAMAADNTMWICHATQSGEKATAQTGDGKSLTCKSMDMHKMMAGPGASKAHSTAELDAMWKDWISTMVGKQ